MTRSFQAILWMLAAGALFAGLNATSRVVALQMDPIVTQFWRYVFGIAVLLPFVLRQGLAAYRPNNLRGQFWRGAWHAAALMLWFIALPHVPLAELTALGFTSPLFIMAGAVLFLGERMVPARWAASALGFLGVLVVVGPQLSGAGGGYMLLLLASSPIMAGSFLITKALSRRDTPEVILLWQSMTVALYVLPFALLNWTWPNAEQAAWLLAAGIIGSLSHYSLNRAFALADISLLQPFKFLDLVWASALGLLLFGDLPGWSTLLGAAIIFAATLWMARHEAKRRAA